MNDKRLLAIKHGRIMLPLIGLILILALVRINSDELIALEVFSIGRMLIDFILVLYALDSIIQVSGLCADRLMLMSSVSRWKIALYNAIVVGVYLLIAHEVGMLPQLYIDSYEISHFYFDLLGYITALTFGLGLMVFVTDLLKDMRSRSSLHICAWILYISLNCLLAYFYIRLFKTFQIDSPWIIGVVNTPSTYNIYAALLPITILDASLVVKSYLQFILINLGMGILVWLAGWLLSLKRNNYLEIN